MKERKNGETIVIYKSPRFSGYIKNSAWKQEAEARLVVTLKDIPNEDFFVPIPESVLMRFEICLGPMTDQDEDTLLSEIRQGVKSQALRNAIFEHRQECKFRGKVHLKRHEYCEYHEQCNDLRRSCR